MSIDKLTELIYVRSATYNQTLTIGPKNEKIDSPAVSKTMPDGGGSDGSGAMLSPSMYGVR